MLDDDDDDDERRRNLIEVCGLPLSSTTQLHATQPSSEIRHFIPGSFISRSLIVY